MVCRLGKGKMAAMVRLLATGNFPEITQEEASHEKLAVQSIHRDLEEADEPNLLEEEDMHVFDSKPLTDPLHLVCCNACKKPIKASQYAAHAERCRSINSTEGSGLGLEGGAGHKKPPRKGRKKMETTPDNQGTHIGVQERSESVDGDNDTAASGCLLDDLTGIVSSFSRGTKHNFSDSRTSMPIEGSLQVESSGVSPGSTKVCAGVKPPSKKRNKLSGLCPSRIGARPLLQTDAVCGVATETGASTHDSRTCKESDSPLPLATKMYHSQKNRLRAAIGHLYHEALVQESGGDSLGPQLVQGNSMSSSLISSHDNLLQTIQKVDTPPNKNDALNMPILRKPDQIFAQSSELCLLEASGGYPRAVNFSNQFRAVETAPLGMMRARFLSSTYSFPGTPGTTLGPVQQPEGSVSVT